MAGPPHIQPSTACRLKLCTDGLFEARRAYNYKEMTLNGGSLGSWIDEERSKVR